MLSDITFYVKGKVFDPVSTGICIRSKFLVLGTFGLTSWCIKFTCSLSQMDRGTDPMDLSELTPARLQSGSSRTQSHAQVGCVHLRGMNRFLMRDNNSSSIGDNSSGSTNGNESGSSTTGASSGGSCCSASSVDQNRVRNILQSCIQENCEAFRIFKSRLERADAEQRQAAGHGNTDHCDSATSVSPPTRRLELDNVTDARHVVHLDYGLDVDQTSVPHTPDVEHVETAVDSARRRRRSVDGERQIVPNSTTDVSVCPTGNIDIMSQFRLTLGMCTAATYTQRYIQGQNLLPCKVSLTVSHIKWILLLIFRRTQVRVLSCISAVWSLDFLELPLFHLEECWESTSNYPMTTSTSLPVHYSLSDLQFDAAWF